MSLMNTTPMSHCPSCGRYVGPHEACPYCGAHLAGRTSIRVLKIVATLLAAVGLVGLWFAAIRTEVPTVPIGHVGAMMNMAYVRLEGHCTRGPSYDPDSGYLSFWIEDETGEIHVSSYRAETRQIVVAGRVPALGDLVEVAGTLRVRDDYLSLTIHVPEQLKITRAAPVDRQIGTIMPEDQYLRVRVRGQVRGITEPYEGLSLVTVRDETGSIPVAVSKDIVALSDISSMPCPGQPVEVVAAVSLYGDTPQLVPASVADIVSLSQALPITVQKPVGELSTADVGQLAVVRGMVAESDPFSYGVKLRLDDGTGALSVLLWQSVYDALLDPGALDVGAEVQAQGEVSQYRGELELIPELAGDVQVLATAPPPAEAAVGALTSEDVGRVVTLRGTLGQPDLFSAGVKFLLDDGTGQIVLLLWTDVYESAPQGLAAGTQVVVTGAVSEYRDGLELIPRNGADLQVTGAGVLSPQPTPRPLLLETPVPTATPILQPAPMPTETPTPVVELTPIGGITADRIGEEVTVEGRVVDAASFSAGFKFTLDDESGRIVLLMWHDVYDDCWDAPELKLGATVRSTGEISQYEGELQVQPGFGGGVKVIEGATAWAAPREIGTLGGDDEGQRVMIEGEIVRVEGLSSAVRVFVSDGTGEIIVFVWRTVLDRIANNTGLGVEGSRVRVVGTMQTYGSNWEVVPQLPNDVIVLRVPE